MPEKRLTKQMTRLKYVPIHSSSGFAKLSPWIKFKSSESCHPVAVDFSSPWPGFRDNSMTLRALLLQSPLPKRLWTLADLDFHPTSHSVCSLIWVSDLTPLSLNFLHCQMGTATPSLRVVVSLYENKNSREHSVLY